MVQREMPIFQVVALPKLAPPELVAACKDRQEAIVLCVQLSRLTHEYIAQRLGTAYR